LYFRYLSKKDGFDQSSLIIQNSIRGIEKKPLPHLLCTTNLILHGIEKPATTKGNLLTIPYDNWKSSNQVNLVLSNPPFGGQENTKLTTKFLFPEKVRAIMPGQRCIIMRIFINGYYDSINNKI